MYISQHNALRWLRCNKIAHCAISAFKETILNATFVFLCANEQNYKFHRSLVLITVEVLKQLYRVQQ